MIPMLALICVILGQADLPGSDLSIAQAKEEASYIVAAEVLKLGDVASSNDQAIVTWIRLKPLVVLKGKLDEETLNRLPLSFTAIKPERLPEVGEELVFFIGHGKFERHFMTTKILPRTAANLDAIEAAQPLPHFEAIRGGISPVHYVGAAPGDEPREWQPEPPRHSLGTRVHPAPNARGELLGVQQAFAAELSKTDPVPEDRRTHFAWIDENENFRRHDGQKLGWLGRITKVEPRPEGGWLVKVSMCPLVRANLRHTLIYDAVEETYEFVDGRARMIRSDAAIAHPRLQIFPMAY